MNEIDMRSERYLEGKTNWKCGVRGPARMILRFLASPWTEVNRDGPHEECVREDEPSAGHAGFERAVGRSGEV